MQSNKFSTKDKNILNNKGLSIENVMQLEKNEQEMNII